MPRCSGTTQAGTRCKRDAIDGSAYCTLHQDQAGEGATETGDEGASGGRDSYRSPLSDAAIVVGVAAVTWAILRRVFRFL